MSTRAGIYLRNSDPRQARDGTHRAALAEAERTAERLAASVVGIYSDLGKSAKTGTLARRGDFARLVADCRAGALDLIIVANLDRFTRSDSIREWGEIWGPIQDCGVKIAISGSGQIVDLSTPEGIMYAVWETTRGARENAARGERSRRGRLGAIERGRPPGPPPFGLLFDPASGTFQEGPGAATVREAYRSVAGGTSCRRTAADFVERKVPTPRWGAWVAASIARLIWNTVYDTGRWRANPGIILQVPVLVDPEVAAEARARLAGYKISGFRRTVHVYLLEGIATCACGARVHIHAVTRRKGGRVYRYAYYTCEQRRRRGDLCRAPRWRTDLLDAALWARVSAWIADPDLVRDGIASWGTEASEAGRTALADLAEWRRRIEGLAEAEAEAFRLRDRGTLSTPGLERRLVDLGSRRRLLERQIASAEAVSRDAAARAATVAELEAALATLRAQCLDAPPEVRRQIVRAACQGLRLGPDGLSGEIAVGTLSAELGRVVAS